MSTPDEVYSYDTFRPAAYVGRHGRQPIPGDDLGEHVVYRLDGTRLSGPLPGPATAPPPWCGRSRG